jgi:hypothetical protein
LLVHGWDLGGFIFLRVADSFCIAICGTNAALASAMEISCFNDLWAYVYSAIASFIIGTLHKMTRVIADRLLAMIAFAYQPEALIRPQ